MDVNPSIFGAALSSFFVASKTIISSVFARNLRLGFTSIHLSLSQSFAMLGSGGIESVLVPTDDNPPVLLSVHGETTSHGKSFHEFQQRDISALVWKVSADDSCNSSTCHSEDDVPVVFVQSSAPKALVPTLSHL